MDEGRVVRSGKHELSCVNERSFRIVPSNLRLPDTGAELSASRAAGCTVPLRFRPIAGSGWIETATGVARYRSLDPDSQS